MNNKETLEFILSIQKEGCGAYRCNHSGPPHKKLCPGSGLLPAFTPGRGEGCLFLRANPKSNRETPEMEAIKEGAKEVIRKIIDGEIKWVM